MFCVLLKRKILLLFPVFKAHKSATLKHFSSACNCPKTFSAKLAGILSTGCEKTQRTYNKILRVFAVRTPPENTNFYWKHVRFFRRAFFKLSYLLVTIINRFTLCYYFFATRSFVFVLFFARHRFRGQALSS